MSESNKIIGIIPSAGIGSRMRPLKIWKELISVGYKEQNYNGKKEIIPKVLAEYTIGNMVNGGVEDFILIINDQKSELLRYFGDGKQNKMNVVYICQDITSQCYGLPIAINTAYRWIKDSTTFLGLPDTIVKPDDCFAELYKTHMEKSSDLTLGIFPTNTPSSLAPVSIDAEGRLLKIYDKPKNSSIYNTWMIAVWSPKFTELLHNYTEKYISNPDNIVKEIILSDIFNLAITLNLNVFGHTFQNGTAMDLGDIQKLMEYKLLIETEQLKNKV